ncbi:MAG: glycosyltransferase family 2 protein [Cyclobacteriaceae bacterium]|nr:glycosyltransferase family 2 protein [Cyclobacteriaceae bacterium]MCX7636372.1 glycosyltransferase family 2 protein [Cyclobacteriaceae bacterium]MDW8331613.1 glycosyltransferase family 2 protein [Cyclobacteriaceae bacterium]
MELSVVVTLYNEAENIAPLLHRIREALHFMHYEIILVDDGSTDNTVEEIRKLMDTDIQLIILNRNYGQTAAMAAGIAHAKGRYIATLDGDLQNDPIDIPRMLDKLKSGKWDVVAGNRANRKDNWLWRKLPSRIANLLIRRLSGVTVHDYGCTLKVFRSELARNLGLYGELHRFIPILSVMQGGRITEMDVKHHPRLHGKSKYGMGRTFKVISDLLLLLFFQKYLRRPIHFFGPLGLVCFGVGSFISLYMLILKIMGQDIWGRPLLLLGIALVLGGIQFLTLGILAEMLMRTYFEAQNKKTYGIREIITVSDLEASEV